MNISILYDVHIFISKRKKYKVGVGGTKQYKKNLGIQFGNSTKEKKKNIEFYLTFIKKYF